MTNLSFSVLWNGSAAQRGMQNLGKATDKTHASFRALKVGAGLALVAATGAAIKFGTSSVKAYVDAQTQQLKLQDAFRKFPKLADTNQAALQRLNTELQKKTKFDDDATASGQAVLAQFKLTGQQITQLTPLLQDYASKTGKDLPTAARDLGKAMLGQGRSLKAVGIDFKDTGTQSGNLDQIMKGLRTQVGGFAEKEGKSAAGQAAILRNQFGELQESAGKQLLPALLKVGQGLLKLVGFVQSNSAIFGTFGKTVKIVFGSIAQAVGLGKVSFQTFSDFVATHQADITSAIIKGGKIFVGFATVIAKGASIGLRAFGALADGVGMGVSFIINGYAVLARGAAEAFGWIPGIGPKLVAADAKFTAFAKHAHDGIHTTGNAARGLADGIDKKLIPGLGKAGQGLDALGKKEIASARNRDIMARAENRHRDAVDAATRAAKTNGKTIDSNTVAGRANRTALINLVGTSQNYIGKLIATHASSKKVTAATQTARAEFVRVATSMGVSATRAHKLADEYFHIPKKSSHTHTQPGMKNAQAQALRLYGDYEKFKNRTVTTKLKYNIPDQKLMNSLGVNIHVSKSGQGSGGGLARGGVLPGNTPLSRGDDVAFPMAGGGIQPLRGGEGIAVSEVMRDPHERALLLAKNKAALRGESMAKFRQAGLARGGFANTLRLPASTEGPNLGDVSAAFNRANQEFGRNLGAKLAKAYNKRIDAAVKKLEASAGGGGGPIGGAAYARGLNWARSHNHHPYVYASLFDCSGFVGGAHSRVLGQPAHRRYTTTAFHGARAAGFTRNKRSPMMVGVRPLSGRLGHMAATINGVNIESAGGVGVRIGSRARGWNNGMFSWRGGLARGGQVGDLPFDLLDPRGERYNPWLADLVHKAGYHKGGRIGANGGPERVLSPPQNRAFENLAFARGGKGGGATYNVTINAPGYIGDKRALADVTVSVLTTLNRQGRLESIKR